MRTQHLLAPSGGIMPIALSTAHGAPTSAGAYKPHFAQFLSGPAAAPATLTDHLMYIREHGAGVLFARSETIFNQDNPAEQACRIVSGTVRPCHSEGILLIPNTSEIVLRDIAALRALAAED